MKAQESGKLKCIGSNKGLEFNEKLDCFNTIANNTGISKGACTVTEQKFQEITFSGTSSSHFRKCYNCNFLIIFLHLRKLK